MKPGAPILIKRVYIFVQMHARTGSLYEGELHILMRMFYETKILS